MFPWAREIPESPAYSSASFGEVDHGSIIVVVATDVPLVSHQLKRLARRVSLGLGRNGSISGNGSGDIFIAFSTANSGAAGADHVVDLKMLPNDLIEQVFASTVQATEEAVVNAMVAAETMTGIENHKVIALPHDRLREVLKKYNRLDAMTPRFQLSLIARLLESSRMDSIRNGLTAALLALGLILTCCSCSSHPPPSLAITHVTLIDATGGVPQPDMTVFLVDERIAVIGPSNSVFLPRKTKTLDASGKFLIPGLVDMHVHLTGAGEPTGSRDFILPLLLANGITTVRDMGGDLESLIALRHEIEHGQLQAPRIFFAGPYLDGQPAFFSHRWSSPIPKRPVKMFTL